VNTIDMKLQPSVGR